MKTEWNRYLDDIGIKGLFLDKVKSVRDFYQELYPDQIEDIFITEYIDQEANRHYESMWLFFKNASNGG